MVRRKPPTHPHAAKTGDFVTASDHLPASVVSDRTEDKHYFLQTYLKYQATVRQGWTQPAGNGATYIDLFCGPGLSLIEGTSRYLDGSPVAAWKASCEQKLPFTTVYIADVDKRCLDACEQRLLELKAPVKVFHGTAADAAAALAQELNPYGLHFGFLDPYSLGQLDFEIIRELAPFRYMDLLVHLSAMDLFRNLEKNESDEVQQFEAYAPGWKAKVDPKLPDHDRRRAVMEHWTSLVDGLGLEATSEMHTIKNSVNRVLYWLALLARHPLAKKFWKAVLKYKPSETVDMFG